MKMSSKTSLAILFLLIGLVCLPVNSSLGQGMPGGTTGGGGGGGTGGPPPPGGGSGGGGGAVSGSGDAHYLYSEDQTGDRLGPPSEWWVNTGYFTDMTFTRGLANGNHSMGYKVKVRDEKDKLKLDPDEIVEVDFEVTLSAYAVPYDWETPNEIGTPIGYHFSTEGFEVLEEVNFHPPTQHEFFPYIGKKYIGYAKLRYTGTGKSSFTIQDTDGAQVGDTHVKVVWCSTAPEPITQANVACAGCNCFDNKGSTSTCTPESVRRVLRQKYLATSDSAGRGGT